MKKNYSEPTTKVVKVNSQSIMNESVGVVSEPQTPPTDEPAPAPMF